MTDTNTTEECHASGDGLQGGLFSDEVTAKPALRCRVRAVNLLSFVFFVRLPI